jgi:AbiTii
MASTYQLSQSTLPDTHEASYLRQPIAAIVAAATSQGQLQVEWPQEMAVKYGAKGYLGFECLGAWQIISTYALMGIVDTVRSRILDFALKIEVENPDAGEALPDSQPVPSDKVQMIFQNTFHGAVANVAQNSHGFTQKTK